MHQLLVGFLCAICQQSRSGSQLRKDKMIPHHVLKEYIIPWRNILCIVIDEGYLYAIIALENQNFAYVILCALLLSMKTYMTPYTMYGDIYCQSNLLQLEIIKNACRKNPYKIMMSQTKFSYVDCFSFMRTKLEKSMRYMILKTISVYFCWCLQNVVLSSFNMHSCQTNVWQFKRMFIKEFKTTVNGMII